MKLQMPRPGISCKSLFGVLVAHAVLFIALIVLFVCSICYNGFVKSPNAKSVFLDSLGKDWDLLWQSVPPAIMSLFAFCRNWVTGEVIYHITRADIERTTNAGISNQPVRNRGDEESASLLGTPRTFSKTIQRRFGIAEDSKEHEG
jgi:hypothetical protein